MHRVNCISDIDCHCSNKFFLYLKHVSFELEKTLILQSQERISENLDSIISTLAHLSSSLRDNMENNSGLFSILDQTSLLVHLNVLLNNIVNINSSDLFVQLFSILSFVCGTSKEASYYFHELIESVLENYLIVCAFDGKGLIYRALANITYTTNKKIYITPQIENDINNIIDNKYDQDIISIIFFLTMNGNTMRSVINYYKILEKIIFDLNFSYSDILILLENRSHELKEDLLKVFINDSIQNLISNSLIDYKNIFHLSFLYVFMASINSLNSINDKQVIINNIKYSFTSTDTEYQSKQKIMDIFELNYVFHDVKDFIIKPDNIDILMKDFLNSNVRDKLIIIDLFFRLGRYCDNIIDSIKKNLNTFYDIIHFTQLDFITNDRIINFLCFMLEMAKKTNREDELKDLIDNIVDKTGKNEKLALFKTYIS